KSANRAAAAVITRRVKSFAPVRIPRMKGDNKKRPPGSLKRAIGKVGEAQEAGGFEVYIGVRSGFGRSHVIRFLERGTRRMGARPFLRRGFNAGREEATAVFIARYQSVLLKESLKS